MYRRELVRQWHAELQGIAKGATVLLGGSYAYGQSTHGSDVDFFVLAPLHRLVSLRRAIRAWKAGYPNANVTVMLVPRLAFRLGYYYTYGYTLAGELVRSPYNRKAYTMSALKLAYYHYIRYQVATTPEEQAQALYKVAQKAAFVQTFRYHQGEAPSVPLAYIKRRCKGILHLRWATEVLEAKLQQQALPIIPVETIQASLEQLYRECAAVRGFSWFNYLVYNLKFLARGRGLFLFSNPDTIILAKMRTALREKQNLSALISQLTDIIFPVIML